MNAIHELQNVTFNFHCYRGSLETPKWKDVEPGRLPFRLLRNRAPSFDRSVFPSVHALLRPDGNKPRADDEPLWKTILQSGV